MKETIEAGAASVKGEIDRAAANLAAMSADAELQATLAAVALACVKALRNGGKVLFCGNGGSAADAQHLAGEFVSRFNYDRAPLAGIALTTDTSVLTAIGNDYGYEKLFRRQLEAQARSGDVFVGITTSGRSRNVLAAFEACKPMGVSSVALCGLGGDLDGLVDHALRAPSSHTPRIQECHILIGHMLCAQVELAMFGHLAPK